MTIRYNLYYQYIIGTHVLYLLAYIFIIVIVQVESTVRYNINFNNNNNFLTLIVDTILVRNVIKFG